MANLKFAVRTLFKKSPFVTAIAIVSLALGIGANAAIFSIFNQILLSSLPVHDPDGLVNLGAPGPKPGGTSCNQGGSCDMVFSYPMFRDLEREQTVFSGLAAHRSFNVSLAYRGQSMTGLGMLVSGSYFPVLGVQPALGRLLGPGDDRATGESAVAVLSHAFWTSRFAEDPNVLNSLLTINGQQFTVVGVAPRGFNGTTFGALAHVFVPVTMRPKVEPNRSGFDSRRAYWLYVFGRLKPGVSIDAARTQINGPYRAILNDVEVPLQQGMSADTLERFKARQVTLEEGSRGQSSAHTDAKAPLLILLGVTTLVLLIACANIANLLLARSAARAGEMAVRLSLGASRAQLVGQLLVESCLLAVLGGAAGLLVSRWTLDAIGSLLPPEAVASVQLGVDATVLMFAGALSLATGLLFGVFPALHSTRPDLVSTLKNQAGQPSGARTAARFRTVLATAQIALSMALLVSAGLFIKSLVNISRIELGLQPDHLVTFNVTPEQMGYSRERSRQFFERLEDALAALPGASSVTASRVPALAGSNTNNSVAVQDFPAGPDTDTNASMNQIAPGYFRTMGIPLISGREFTRGDTLKTPRVAIVNEAFAKKFNLGRDAVGKRMGDDGITGTLTMEIVGLVRDAKYSRVRDSVPPQYFLPYRQVESISGLTFYVRTETNPEEFLSNIPKTLTALDPNLPIRNLRTMPDQVRQNIFLDRFISTLAGVFAALATLLAAVGLYGVLAYTVSQRTREIGLRMALGAAPGRVRFMVLKQVAWMTCVGGAVGLAAAVAVGQLAQSLLYQLKGYDALVLIASSVALGLVALGAGFIPALRASRVDPMLALRYE
jgi:predicted permease